MSNASDSGLVIGIGHAERQDDGVGPHVARALAGRGLPAIVHEGDGTGLLDLWDHQCACIVIDAMESAEEPGTIRVFTDVEDAEFARASFVHSSHRIGLPEAVALGRALSRMPRRLTVIGVSGTDFGFGSALSPPVAAAAERLIDRLACDGWDIGAPPRGSPKGQDHA